MAYKHIMNKYYTTTICNISKEKQIIIKYHNFIRHMLNTNIFHL